MLFHQLAAQFFVGLAAAEQHAVGHDDGGAPAGFEQAQEQGQKEQLGLFGFDGLLQILGGVFVVQAAGKGWVGQDEAVGLGIARRAFGEESRYSMAGCSTPCSTMFMLPMRSMVLSKSYPWNMPLWKCAFCAGTRSMSG